MKKKIKSEKQKLQSVKKLLELNMQTVVSVLLTFPQLNNLYFWEWTTWSEGKHSGTEGPVTKKELTELFL